MEPALPIPDFTMVLTTAAVGLFIVSALLLIMFRGRIADTAIPAALVPFLIPLCATALTLTIIPIIGSLLLAVGKDIAVPLAMSLSVAILLICAFLSGGSSREEAR